MEARQLVEFTGVELVALGKKVDPALEKATRRSGGAGEMEHGTAEDTARDGGAAWSGMGARVGDRGSRWQ